MQVYWSLAQIPELEGLSKTERRQLFRACESQYLQRVGYSWFTLFILVTVYPISSILGALAMSLTSISDPHWRPYLDFVCYMPVGASLVWIGHLMRLNSLRPHYAEYVKAAAQKDKAIGNADNVSLGA